MLPRPATAVTHPAAAALQAEVEAIIAAVSQPPLPQHSLAAEVEQAAAKAGQRAVVQEGVGWHLGATLMLEATPTPRARL